LSHREYLSTVHIKTLLLAASPRVCIALRTGRVLQKHHDPRPHGFALAAFSRSRRLMFLLRFLPKAEDVRASEHQEQHTSQVYSLKRVLPVTSNGELK
jgi:hypothetical protein